MTNYRIILYATDLLDACEDIGHRAVKIAQCFQGQLSLLHVVEHLPVDLDDGLLPAPPGILDEELIREARISLDRLGEQLGITPENRLLEVGSTKAEVLRACRERHADLLITGSHSRHGLALLLGSTAKSLINDVPCDMLSIKIQ